jgi:hypothetical protein
MSRRTWFLAALVVVFLTLGVPRWLAGDVARVVPNAHAEFSKLCREHGGTPATTQRCSVRYGRRVYLMDAITPDGFDEDTARYQRQGCEQQESHAPSRPRRPFIYHPATGVCEHRP